TAYGMASRIAGRVYFGGRPPGLWAGTRGSRTAHNSSLIRAGYAEAVDIRVGFMPAKLPLTDQRIQGYFPHRHLGTSVHSAQTRAWGRARPTDAGPTNTTTFSASG